MARRRDTLLLLVIALALGAAYLAVRYRLLPAVAALIGGAGAYAMVSGVRMIVTRLAHVPTGGSQLNPRMEHHTGLTARMWGLLFVMVGALAIALAYALLRFPDGSPDLPRDLLGTPFRSGLVTTAAGTMIGMYGATRLFASTSAFADTRLSTADRYSSGILFSLTGVVLVAGGLLRMIAPELLASLGNALLGVVARLFGRGST